MKVSCCMISWCEAKTIDLSLRSLEGFVDEVIIADTGSFDGTVKIAREWIDKLNYSGEVISVKTKSLGQARIASWKKCIGDWILVIDSNLVLSNALKQNLKGFLPHPTKMGGIRSLNLTGDYNHFYTQLKFHAHHQSLFHRNHMHFADDEDRPLGRGSHMHFIGPAAVNLSRVRPAWRYWYRGEAWDPRYNIGHGKGGTFASKSNTQYQWTKQRKYDSLIDYVKTEMNLSFEDVKRIAPKWYLEQLQKYARRLEPDLVNKLPEVIKEERKNPRYKLIYKDGKIVGRWPEL